MAYPPEGAFHDGARFLSVTTIVNDSSSLIAPSLTETDAG
jgi:hypothetical protein